MDLIAEFLSRYDRAQTRRAYRSDLVSFFGTDSCPEVSRLVGVTPEAVNRYLERMEVDGASPSTMRRRLCAIRTFFDWLRATGAVNGLSHEIVHNPADKMLVRRVRPQRDSVKVVLSKAQARQLVEAAAGAGRAALRDRALLMMLIHGCLRRSEASAIDVEHIRMSGPYWVLELPETKGGSGEWVKLPAQVVEAIEEMKRHYDIEAGPLFRSLSGRSAGGRLSGDAIYRVVRRTAERAGLPGDGLSPIGAHALRHTGCTLAIEAGATLQQVQAHARHKSIATTMTYVHQRDRLRDSASDYIRY